MSDDNRSEGQGGFRKELSRKKSVAKTRPQEHKRGREAALRAISVLGNAKSNGHRKTQRVEPGGAGRRFMELTRGDPRPEREGEVSRGRSSEEGPGNGKGVANDT